MLGCNSSGACSYTPAPDDSGSYQVGYTVSDGSLSTNGVFTILVSPCERRAGASNSSVATSEDTALPITLGRPTPKATRSPTTSPSAPSHGVLVCTTNSCVYTPGAELLRSGLLRLVGRRRPRRRGHRDGFDHRDPRERHADAARHVDHHGRRGPGHVRSSRVGRRRQPAHVLDRHDNDARNADREPNHWRSHVHAGDGLTTAPTRSCSGSPIPAEPTRLHTARSV